MIGALAASGVGVAITNRWGGVSASPYDQLNLGFGSGDGPDAVQENRRRVASSFDLEARQVVWMRQVHGREVAGVDGPVDVPPRVDGVVTTVTGAALAVLVADCVPVLLADRDARVIGAAHAGRQGMASGVVPAVVAAMRERGASPQRIAATVGPAICGRCYEVPESMQHDVAARVPQAGCRTRQGARGLDIRAGVVAQLATVGIDQIERDPRCTAESPELYSYRRDGRTGRFAGYVWLVPDGSGEQRGASDDG